MNSHDDVNRSFQASMRSLVKTETPALLNAYDFCDFHTIVDVGGGNGTFLSAILTSCPNVSGVLLDRQNTIELARAEAGGPLPRCEFVAGDYFKEIPAGGNLYILKRIIQSCNDDDAITILKNCRGAMGKNSKVLIIENLLGPPNQHSLATQRDITMLVIVGGMERREEEYRSLLEQADLKLDRVVDTNTNVSILEAHAI